MVAASNPSRRPARTEVRERVLEAALRVFAAGGYDGCSLDDVAKEAGFTKGALYSNFSSKQELFLALMDQQIERRTRLAMELIEGQAVDLVSLGQLLTHAALADRQWQLLFLDYWSRALRNPELLIGFVAHRRNARRRIEAAVEQTLAQSGESAALSSEHISLLLLVLSNGLAIEGLPDPSLAIDELFGAVLGGVVAKTS